MLMYYFAVIEKQKSLSLILYVSIICNTPCLYSKKKLGQVCDPAPGTQWLHCNPFLEQSMAQ